MNPDEANASASAVAHHATRISCARRPKRPALESIACERNLADTKEGGSGSVTGLRSMGSMGLAGLGSTKRVLIVEDNDDNRKILVYRLRRIGDLEIDEASNGLEALHAVATRAPDLVIMDVHMPIMDGLEAARRIRELDDDRGTVPIIALTAEPLDERRGDECSNVTDFLQKPIIDPAALRAKVTYWLERRHGERSFVPSLAASVAR